MNKQFHNTMCIISSIPTSSDYVELRVLSLCFDDVEYRCPLPRLMVPPVWPWQSLCTPYDASIHHLMIMVPSASSVSGNHVFALRYLMVWCNFLQSSLSGSRTRVHIKDIDVWISGLTLLDRYGSLDTRLRNRLPSSLLIFSLYFYTSNRWLASGVSARPWNSSGELSRTSCIYCVFGVN